jgi:predicted metal-dependent HD superfamily phosphohydrolase
MYNIGKLHRKWQKCWISIFSQREIDHLFGLLVSTYSQSDRHYHNLNHISQVLNTIDRFADELENPTAVKLAVWFHDFIYSPCALDNEVKSAEIVRELLLIEIYSVACVRYHLKGLIDRAQQLILATQGHQIDRNDPRSMYLSRRRSSHPRHQPNQISSLCSIDPPRI